MFSLNLVSILKYVYPPFGGLNPGTQLYKYILNPPANQPEADRIEVWCTLQIFLTFPDGVALEFWHGHNYKILQIILKTQFSLN